MRGTGCASTAAAAALPRIVTTSTAPMAKILDLNASAPYLIRLSVFQTLVQQWPYLPFGGVCTMRLMAPSLIVAGLLFSSLPFPAASAQTTPSPEGGRATPV